MKRVVVKRDVVKAAPKSDRMNRMVETRPTSCSVRVIQAFSSALVIPVVVSVCRPIQPKDMMNNLCRL